MIRPLTVAVILAIIAAGGAFATLDGRIRAYRAQKLEILRPRALTPVLDRAGETRRTGPKVYLVGDSQISHWPLTRSGTWRLYRSGFAGEATPNIVSTILPFMSEVRPDAVIVISGGNDLSAIALLPPDEREAAVQRSVEAFRIVRDAARAAGAKQIFLPYVAPNRRSWLVQRLVWGGPTDRLAGRFNQGVSAVCDATCHVIDLAALLGIHTAADWKPYLSDHVHLNDVAYERLVEEYGRLVRP